MSALKGASPALCVDRDGARKIVATGKRDWQSSNASSEQTQVIRAELAESDTATALGIIAKGSAPIIKLCRLLVEAGHDPATPLEAWRGGTPCLRIRSIGEAAQLRVASHGIGFERPQECTAAPPIELNGSGDTDPAPWVDWPPHEGAMP